MPRILFVATLYNPLASRWITQLKDTEWDVHVFGTQDKIHSLFAAENITVHTNQPVENKHGVRVMKHNDLWPFRRGRYRLNNFPLIGNLIREPHEHLARIIRIYQPDIVHSLKMHKEVLLVQDAYSLLNPRERPKWIYSVWGSDIYLNRNFPERLGQINRILPQIDYLMADNPRDIVLALEHGFNGKVLGVFPTGGGYPVREMRARVQSLPSMRKIIAVKGYQAETTGQVLTALEAIKRCGKALSGYRIIIHSAIGTYASSHLDEVRVLAEEVSLLCNVEADFLPFVSPEAIWEVFAQSRIHIAISKSDGTPNAMLEAMIVGAFPIQSDTGGLEQWITSGENGYLVPYEQIDEITSAILHAIQDDALVDQAAIKNYEITEDRLDRAKISSQILGIYYNLIDEAKVRNV